MISARDLIRVLRFPLQEVSDWMSLASPSHLDYGAVAEVCLLLHPPGCILGSADVLNYRRGNTPLTMSVVYGVLVVFGACLAAVLGLALVRGLGPTAIRQEQDEVEGFVDAALVAI